VRAATCSARDTDHPRSSPKVEHERSTRGTIGAPWRRSTHVERFHVVSMRRGLSKLLPLTLTLSPLREERNGERERAAVH
jgi:hypothetical protein